MYACKLLMAWFIFCLVGVVYANVKCQYKGQKWNLQTGQMNFTCICTSNKTYECSERHNHDVTSSPTKEQSVIQSKLTTEAQKSMVTKATTHRPMFIQSNMQATTQPTSLNIVSTTVPDNLDKSSIKVLSVLSSPKPTTKKAVIPSLSSGQLLKTTDDLKHHDVTTSHSTTGNFSIFNTEPKRPVSKAPRWLPPRLLVFLVVTYSCKEIVFPNYRL